MRWLLIGAIACSFVGIVVELSPREESDVSVLALEKDKQKAIEQHQELLSRIAVGEAEVETLQLDVKDRRLERWIRLNTAYARPGDRVFRPVVDIKAGSMNKGGERKQ